MVEHNAPNIEARFRLLYSLPCCHNKHARVAQLVERLVANEEVMGSSPISRSMMIGLVG